MNKKFDKLKQTLTSFKRSDFDRAAAEPDDDQVAPPEEAVPQQRTTLRLDKVRGVVSPKQTKATDPVEAEPTPPPQAPSPAPEGTDQSPAIPDQQTDPTPIQPPLTPEPVAVAEPSAPHLDTPPGAASVPDQSDEPLQLPPESENRTERSAALYAQTSVPSPKKASQQTTTQCNFRMERQLLDMFKNKCEQEGKSVSKVLRNMVKAYLGLCLLLLLSTPAHPGQQDTASTASTSQIIDYLFSKAFGFSTSLVDARTTLTARQSLWTSGEQDSTDYIYRDRSNTRLEVRLDLPLFDLSYYRDRSKQKRECRASIMKSLSKILAAQKSVNALENRLGVLNTRLGYLKGQVKLGLANKTQLFPIEDQILTAQAQLFESQSTLEQRIIDLAIIASNHWYDAYRMIVRWDGKLFEDPKSEGRG